MQTLTRFSIPIVSLASLCVANIAQAQDHSKVIESGEITRQWPVSAPEDQMSWLNAQNTAMRFALTAYNIRRHTVEAAGNEMVIESIEFGMKMVEVSSFTHTELHGWPQVWGHHYYSICTILKGASPGG